jgi:NADP-dependent 3-hydroxy acid dehydrogenase YdfG
LAETDTGSFTHAFSVVCDVSAHEDVARMSKVIQGKVNRLDILVNNAGYALYRTFVDTDISDICRLAEVNLLGAMRCIRTFLPAMIEQKSGTIVSMASIAGRSTSDSNSVYCAAKHGLIALSGRCSTEASSLQHPRCT